MAENLVRLLSLASEPILGRSSQPLSFPLMGIDRLINELSALLSDKNGFYAFESALVVRPMDSDGNPYGIAQWNLTSSWKKEYKINLSDSIFFAEDIFGIQFCLKKDAVYSFNPETAEFKKIGNSLEAWAQWLLADHKFTTGWPLAHQWQVKHGALEPGMRLLPKVPFVCGGEYTVENLYACLDVEGMSFRASIANQLIGVPDGTQIVMKIDRKN